LPESPNYTDNYSWESLASLLKDLIRELDPSYEYSDIEDVDIDQAMRESSFGGS
jgi:hypothetical protein